MWSVHASKHTSIQAYTRTRARNEVTLVWGSLRLAPNTVNKRILIIANKRIHIISAYI